MTSSSFSVPQALFGITTSEAEAFPRPADRDDIERQRITEQVQAFEREGWDVTDSRRRPLRTLGHFNQAALARHPGRRWPAPVTARRARSGRLGQVAGRARQALPKALSPTQAHGSTITRRELFDRGLVHPDEQARGRVRRLASGEAR